MDVGKLRRKWALVAQTVEVQEVAVLVHFMHLCQFSNITRTDSLQRSSNFVVVTVCRGPEPLRVRCSTLVAHFNMRYLFTQNAYVPLLSWRTFEVIRWSPIPYHSMNAQQRRETSCPLHAAHDDNQEA